MLKRLNQAFYILICTVLVIQLSGCGTIMYPERRGQTGGHVDAGVAVLDGIGLLFFIIPGVIAFAVDFGNGTIYLPGKYSSALNLKDMKQAKFDSKHYSNATIEKIIKDETGYSVALGQGNMQISRLQSTDDMMMRFAQVLPTIKKTRIALKTDQARR
jgi:hypothetical protein